MFLILSFILSCLSCFAYNRRTMKETEKQQKKGRGKRRIRERENFGKDLEWPFTSRLGDLQFIFILMKKYDITKVCEVRSNCKKSLN